MSTKAQPTDIPPGPAKVAALEERYDRGLPLWHEQDACWDDLADLGMATISNGNYKNVIGFAVEQGDGRAGEVIRFAKAAPVGWGGREQ